MAYSKNTWATGDVITAEKLNSIENAVGNVSSSIDSLAPSIARIDNIENTIESLNSEIASARNYNGAGTANTLGGRIDELVRISNTQPNGNNEIWVNSGNGVIETEVPTYEEFNELKNSNTPEYSNNAIYAVGEYVFHNGNLYRCQTAITTAETWTAAHWTQVVFGNEIRDLKSTIITVNKSEIINDAWLSNNSITDLVNLPLNAVYLLSNLSQSSCANMPPIPSGQTVTTGTLMSYKPRVDPAFGVSYIYVDIQGRTCTGSLVSGNIRWKVIVNSNDLQSAISTEASAREAADNEIKSSVITVNKSEIINDAWLAANNITDLANLPYNTVHLLTGLSQSSCANMPPIPNGESTIAGSLMVYKPRTNAAYGVNYFFVDSQGRSYTGSLVNGMIRWKAGASNETVENAIYKDVNYLTYPFYNRKLLILGDSIVYGSHMPDTAQGDRKVVELSDGTVYYNNTSATVWSAKFAQYVESVYNMTVINNSWPGAKYQDLVSYYDQIVTQDYNFVIICMGVNNWNSGAAIITALETLHNKFTDAGTKMIVLTPLGSTTYARELGQIRGFIKNYGIQRHIEIPDLYSAFNFANYMHGRSLSDVLVDGMHYNAASQDDICESVKQVLHI